VSNPVRDTHAIGIRVVGLSEARVCRRNARRNALSKSTAGHASLHRPAELKVYLPRSGLLQAISDRHQILRMTIDER
jgi:hypothetical protein